MAKIIPIVTDENGYNFRQKPAPTPRRTAAEMEVSRLRAELHEMQVKIGNQKWQLDCEARRNSGLEDKIRQLTFELRSARSSSGSGTTLDLGLWRRILKLVHPDYHSGNPDAVEVTKAVIAMKPRI